MSSMVIDVDNAAKESKYSNKVFWHGVFVWGLATLFYFFDNLLNVAPAAMKPELSQAFQLSAADLGILSSCYLWPYGLMQIPAGLLMDRVGPRRLLAVASLSCALGAGLFGMANSLLTACIARGFIGFGASFAVVGCGKIASVWFSSRQFALFMGLMVAVGMLGAAFGLATVSSVIHVFGWRNAMLTGAGIALGLSILFWFSIRDKPTTISQQQAASMETVPVLQGLREVIGCRQGWLAALYAGLMFVPTLAFGGLWGTPYLVEAHGYSQESGGILASLVFIGWVFAGPIYGWVSDHMGKRNPPMYFANITTLVVTMWIIWGTNMSFWTMGTALFLLGFFSSGFIIAFAVTREKNRPAISGTAIGFINMINTFSVALFQWLIGQILDWISAEPAVAGVEKIYSLSDYQTALMTIPVCLLVAIFTLLPVKETNCKPKY